MHGSWCKVFVGINNSADDNAALLGNFIAVLTEFLFDSFFGIDHSSQLIENDFQLDFNIDISNCQSNCPERTMYGRIEMCNAPHMDFA